MLLVHGLGSSFGHNWLGSGWGDLLAMEEREVVGFDLPGHGSSAAVDGSAAVEELSAVLTAHGQVDAVGFSAGALLLLAAAVQAPGAFRRLALLGVGDGLWSAPEDAAALPAALESGTAAEDPRLRVFQRLAVSAGNDPVRVAGYLRTAPRPPALAELGVIGCPVLVVLGDRDAAGPATGLCAALPDARLAELRGVDHMATTSDYRCQDRVLRFLAD